MIRSGAINWSSAINGGSGLNAGLAMHLLARPRIGGTTWLDVCGRYNGTVSGSPLWVEKPGRKAMSFNGSNYVNVVGGGTAFDVGASQQFTVGAWVFFNDSGQQFLLCKTQGSGSIGYDILLNGGGVSGDISFRTVGVGVGGVDIGPSGGWNDSKWHFVVGTREGGSLKLYVDGIQRGSGTAHTDSLSDTSAPFQISARNGTPLAGTNAVDGVFVYPNRGLTSDAIWQLYQEGLTGYPTTLNRIQRRIAYVAAAPPAGGKARIIGGGLAA